MSVALPTTAPVLVTVHCSMLNMLLKDETSVWQATKSASCVRLPNPFSPPMELVAFVKQTREDKAQVLQRVLFFELPAVVARPFKLKTSKLLATLAADDILE